jgi:hypothetical protein
MDPDRLLRRCRRGDVSNVRFADMQRLVVALGFELVRVSASHHIYRHALLREKINLQESDGMAKPYQVRQVVGLVHRYALSVENHL